jgi:hypothetical protein
MTGPNGGEISSLARKGLNPRKRRVLRLAERVGVLSRSYVIRPNSRQFARSRWHSRHWFLRLVAPTFADWPPLAPSCERMSRKMSLAPSLRDASRAGRRTQASRHRPCAPVSRTAADRPVGRHWPTDRYQRHSAAWLSTGARGSPHYGARQAKLDASFGSPRPE